MGIYGIDFYGTTTYGAPLYLEFDARPFTATPIGYGALRLDWVNPEGNWDRLRVVRSSYGYPLFPEDGTTILDQGDVSNTALIDREVREGRFFYYSIFVREIENDVWVRAGDATGLPVENHGYGERLFRLMPGFMQEADLSLARYEGDDGPLRRYLDVLGISIDHIRTEYETLRWLRNPDKIAGNLLPPLAQMFGVPNEPAIGMRQTRVWLRDAVYLYRTKGTRPGVEAAASAITGWGARVSWGKNLLRTQGAHAWHHSGQLIDSVEPDNPQRPALWIPETGSWQMSNIPLTWEPPPSSTSLDPPWSNLPLSWASLPRDWAAETVSRDNTPRWFGVGVTPLTDYTVSIRVRPGPGQPSKDYWWTVNWYDQDGVELAEVDGTPQASIPQDWVRVMGVFNSPPGAVYASITLHGEGPTFLSRAQFEQNNDFSGWEEPSALVINFDPVRWNFIPNPSFENGLFGWILEEGSVAPGEDPVSDTGSRSALVNGSMTTFMLGLATLGVPHVFSAYVEGPSEVNLQINFFESPSDEHPAGSVDREFSLGPGIHRVSVSGTPPAGCEFATVGITTDRPTNVDATQLEEGSEPSDYFDGSSFGADYLWSEFPHVSPSKYYPSRTERNVRVRELLPDFLPYGQEFILNYVGGAPSSGRLATGDQGTLGVGTYGIMPFGK